MDVSDKIAMMSKMDRRSSGSVITSLASSLEPLREYFNANKDKLRFLAIVSPT